MMPQTVPKSPTKGETLAVVARKLRRRSRRVLSTVAARISDRESDSRLRTVGLPWAGADELPAHLLVHLEVAGLEDADERAAPQLRCRRS